MKFKMLKKNRQILYPIEDQEGYFVNRAGAIWSNRKYGSNPNSELRKLKPGRNGKSGYPTVALCPDMKSKTVHRLVAQTLIPNPLKKRCVNHINGIKTDNRVENLEWRTSSENNRHAYKMGLKTKSPKAGTPKRSVRQLDLDGNFLAEFESLNEAGRKVKVNPKSIFRVCRGIRKTTGGYKWRYKI